MITVPKTERYLIMVDACTNHDKYFKMIPNGSTFTAEYNNVGLAPQTKEYPIEKWDALYVSKKAKGYEDKTDLRQNALDLVPVTASQKKITTYKEIVQKSVRDIVSKLQKLSKQNVTQNYQVACELVTLEMINEAQIIIDTLGTASTLWQFNEQLMKLFMVIPRKMSDVMSFCAKTDKDFGEIIQKEQDMLDNMKSQVVQLQKTVKKKQEEQKTILESLGLIFEELSEEEEKTVKEHMEMGDMNGRFCRAWKVINEETEEKFNQYCRKNKINKFKYCYHGSRSENWWSIINSGLALRPTNVQITGKMFGYGLYFAPKSKKSSGYTSTSGSYWANGSDSMGYMAVYKIAYGKPYNVYQHSSQLSSMTEQDLQGIAPGSNCVHAHAGSMLCNDEIIIYNENACTIRYLIEFK